MVSMKIFQGCGGGGALQITYVYSKYALKIIAHYLLFIMFSAIKFYLDAKMAAIFVWRFDEKNS